MSCADARRIIIDTQQVLDDLNEFPILHQRLRYVEYKENGTTDDKSRKIESCAPDIVKGNDSKPTLWVEIVPGGNYSFELMRASAAAVVHYSNTQMSTLPQYLADSIRNTFAEEQISIAHQYTLHAQNNGHANNFLRSAPIDVVQEVVRRDARALKHSTLYHLTFSLFTASGSPSSWDIEAALDSHIRPLIHAASASSHFSITTQVQLYSSFSPSIQLFKSNNRNGTILRQEDLSAFVNAAEWPLSPSIGSGPTLNFIIYVPTKDQIPLSIDNSYSNSWLIPQWGGITILNPPLQTHQETGLQTVPLHLSEDLLDGPFQLFSTQLLSLLGVPSPSLPLVMRLESQQRLAALSLFLRASSSLGSLAHLAQHLSNIPIPRHVAQFVDMAILQLRSSNAHFQHGNWEFALHAAGVAYEQAEKAFFDKSMVGQVYFPDEHKIAVYLPLLGPICVPLVLGFLKEVKRFIHKG
jgi:GPI-anchor transamidase subunit S